MARTASSSCSIPVADPPSTCHPPKPPYLRPSQSHPPIFLATAAASIRAGAAGGGYPPRPATSDRVITVANPAGYIRNSSPTAVMTFTQAQAQAQAQAQSRPLVFVDQNPGVGHTMMRPLAQQFLVPRQIVPSSAAHKNTAAAAPAQPKVATFSTVSSAPENKNSNDRDKCRDDAVVVIHGRKVRLSEGSSGSLYSLCRSWVRNGLLQETEPAIGDGLKLLPKPLPASMVNSTPLKQSADANDGENSDKEDRGSGDQLSAKDLLEGHIKRGKNVRARLRKERLLRIERYKHRLSLLLPPQIELLGRNEATA